MTTKEPQYHVLLRAASTGLTTLGLMNNHVWQEDPRRLAFTLSRYKFVAKMLSGKHRVLEVGCGDAFGSRIVAQEVTDLTVTDFDPLFIADVAARSDPEWPMQAVVHDMVVGPYPGTFDAIYCLDVLEHIRPADERAFLDHILASLDPTGLLIVGMPSLESQPYASPISLSGHVNCKTGAALRQVLESAFHNVLMFSMNDEVVHTGFLPMAHYLLAVCATPR